MGPARASLMQFLSSVPLFERVVRMFQQPREPVLLPGSSGVDNEQGAALDGLNVPAVSESVETKVLDGLTHNTNQEDTSRRQDTEAQGQEEAGEGGEPIKGGQVIDQHREESSSRLSRVSKRGRKRPSSTEPCEHKKCTRSGNWTPDETDRLIKSKVRALRDEKTCVGRIGKCRSKKQVWEKIAGDVPGRTSDQCRLRWDTLVKSYKKIKEYCECHKTEFSQLNEEEFQSMKLATFFRNADWYKMIDENYPLRPMSGDLLTSLNGASTSILTSRELAGALSDGSLNPNALPLVVLMPSSPVDQSEIASAGLEATELGRNMELASSARTQCWQSMFWIKVDSFETYSLVSNGRMQY